MAGLVYPISYKADSSGLKKAESEFKSFAHGVKTILGAVGISLGIEAAVGLIKDSITAAAQDAKSQALLATQVRATTGATTDQIAQMEKAIGTMQNYAGVADDNIRPAMAQLVRATKDVGAATKLTDLALNVSAGTGKDLQSVAIALGKAYQGNSGAITKLGISVKGLHDPLGFLETQFAGAAAAAAQTDPMQRLGILFDDLKEKLGTALLPQLNAFADWLADPVHAQEAGNLATSIGQSIGSIAYELSGLIEGLAMTGYAFDNLFSNPGESFKVLGMTVGDAYDYIMKKQAEAAKATQKLYSGPMIDPLTGKSQITPLFVKQNLSGAVDPLAAAAEAKAAAARKAAAAKAAAAAKKEAAQLAAEIKKAQDAANQLYKDAMDAFTALSDANVAFQRSFKDVISAFKSMANLAPTMGQFETAVVNQFQNITDAAQQAFDNKLITETALNELKSYASKEQTILQSIGKQRDAIAAKISLAQALYSDTKNAITNFGDITSLLKSQTQTVQQTTTEILNGVSTTITKSVELASQNDLVAEYQKIIDKTKAFAVNLKALKSAGLDSNLFKQIIDAGVDAGGATAAAIIAGGSGTISELNSLFADLQKTGADVAEATTVVMYNNGVDVVGGFIAGLQSQDSLLEQQATSMATLFADTFTGLINSAIGASLTNAANQVNSASNNASVDASTLNTYDLAKQLAGNAADYYSSSESVRFARIAQQNHIQVAPPQVTVTVGGKEIVSAIKTYERANGSVWVSA